MFLALLASLGFGPAKGEVSPDTALMQGLLRQDVNAFEQLYDRHSRQVYSLVLRILQQAATAEEVVQDVFLQLWRNAAAYDAERGPIVPWLLTLARNRALDHLRLKSERQRRREDQTDELPDGRPSAAAEARHRAGLLRRAEPLGNCPEAERAARHGKELDSQRTFAFEGRIADGFVNELWPTATNFAN